MSSFDQNICFGVCSFYRLGFLIDFLSHAAIVGFMGGAAVTIALQQLKGLFGIKKFTKKTDIINVMKSVVNSAEHGVSWAVIVIHTHKRLFQLRCIDLSFSSSSVELSNNSDRSCLLDLPFGCKVHCKTNFSLLEF